LFILRAGGVLLLVFVLAALIYGVLAKDPRVIPVMLRVLRWGVMLAALGVGLYFVGRLVGWVL